MKDNEIKEILDRLERIDHKEYSGGFEFADSSTFDEMARCFEERKKRLNLEAQKYFDLYAGEIYYKSRIDKAIEYIKENNVITTNKEYLPNGMSYCCDKQLLDILQGDNKE